MNKAELLEFVQSLPDDAECMPFDITRETITNGEWYPSDDNSLAIGVHKRDVKYNLTLDLVYTVTQAADFKRTYEDPQGIFSNLRRVK